MTDEEGRQRARRYIRSEHMTLKQFLDEFPNQFVKNNRQTFEAEKIFSPPGMDKFKGKEGGFVPSTPRVVRPTAIQTLRLFLANPNPRRAQAEGTRYIRAKNGRILKQSVSTSKFAKFTEAEKQALASRAG